MYITIASKKKLLVEALVHLLKDKADYGGLDSIDSLEEDRCYDLLNQSDVIVLTDPGFDCSTLTALARLQSLSQKKPVVLVSSKLEMGSAAGLFKNSVRAILTKDCVVEQLHNAIETAATGKPYLTPMTAQALAADLCIDHSREKKLSPREIEIMGYIARGTPTSEIAKLLRLSSKTVSTHKSSIKVRLNLHSTSQIVQYAIEHGFLRGQSPEAYSTA